MHIQSTTIELRNLKLHGFHGVSPIEQQVGCNFNINIQLKANVSPSALNNDTLSGTINYAEVKNVITQQFSQPSHLIEHIAHRIASALFEQFSRIESLTLTIEKINPPIKEDCQSAAFTLIASRNQ